MVLAPADFYAYSRATGAPVPQTPEERAQIATDVLEFRRNQLKAPEEKPDTLKAIGAATLAVAGALGAGFGAKRFLDRRAQIPKGPAKSATAGVRQADLSKMMDALEPATKVDLTGLQESTAPLQRGQTFEALDSGQAQMEQRVEMNVRRNEDVDLTEFAINKEIANQSELPAGAAPDVATNVAASKLPDGIPLDQAERSLSDPWAGSATVPLPQRSTDIFPEIKLLPESAGTRRLSAQEMADIARDEMIALRQEVARQSQRPKTIRTKSGKLRVVPESTERSERQLAKSWVTKPTPGAEPGSTAFRELQEQGQVDLSLPRVIRSAVERVEELPEEEALQSKFLRSVSNVGPGAQVTSTAAGTAIRGAAPVYETVEPQQRTRQIFGTPDSLVTGALDETMPDYPASYSAMHQILAKTELPERIDPYAEKRLKGGSAGIGVYGPELSYVPGAMSKSTGEYSKAAGRTPTYVPKWLQQREGPTGFGALTTDQIRTGAQKAPEGSVKNAFEAELNRRIRAKDSIALSELMRRGMIEGLF